MRLNIKSRKLPLTEDIRTHVEDRVNSALDHVPAQISMVNVGLADVNGPRGGPDKLCRIRIKLADGGVIVVSEPDPNIFRAVDRATTRAKRLVNEHIRKRTRHRRNRDTIRDWTSPVNDDEVDPDVAVERSA